MAKRNNNVSFSNANITMENLVITEIKKDGEYPYSITKVVSSYPEDAELAISLKPINRQILHDIIALLDGHEGVTLSIKQENAVDDLLADEQE